MYGIETSTAWVHSSKSKAFSAPACNLAALYSTRTSSRGRFKNLKISRQFLLRVVLLTTFAFSYQHCSTQRYSSCRTAPTLSVVVLFPYYVREVCGDAREASPAHSMFLKEVIIDGFKSYATRTLVSDFDPSFNAITGLNGSGKSNVLDSICFVLGITNLSQVRASSLQELVYKSGQAGVTKASVTLVFNNSDKDTAPVGYETSPEITVTRQIVIGGRNKYLVNGVNAQPGRVQNLFHSVGLNVNNPHFLIMQGRITKVINMKPPEVLSMIEEAAGTKMYENKKEAALKTIEKKERKVEEINSLLEEKINPQLAKLERERKHYLEWNENNNELVLLKRYLIAHDYFRALRILGQNSDAGTELSDRVTVIEGSLESLAVEQEAAANRLNELTRERAQQMDDGTLEALQDKVDDLSKNLVQMQSVWTNNKQALEGDSASLKQLQDSVESLKNNRSSLKERAAEAKSQIEPAKEQLLQASTRLEEAETALLTGASTQGSQAAATGSAIDQLESARRAVSAAQTQIESLKLEMKHVQAEMNSKAEQLARDRASVRTLEAERKAADKAISMAKMAVHELDFDADAADKLKQKLLEEQGIVTTLRDKVDQLSAKVSSCEFRYADPYPDFDRRKVHGLIAKLVHVKDPKVTTAVEVTAGGRLYHVVVDNDRTANDVLKRGNLVRRVTILPLNKIRHEVISRAKVQAAKEIEPSAELALSLVGYEQEVANAIEHVFGRTIICPDMNSAKRVTFDGRVKSRTVTLEGDTYDPSGTASGGSSSRQGPSVLTLLGELNDAEAELRVHRGNLERLESQFAKISDKGKRFRQLQAALEVREDEAKHLERRLGETSTGQLLNEVDTLKKRYSEEIPTALKDAEGTLASESQKARDLEESMQDSKAAKERAMKEAEATLEKIRLDRENAASALQAAKDSHDSLLVELETAEEEVRRLDQQALEARATVDSLKKLVATQETDVAEAREALERTQVELSEKQNSLAASSKALRKAKRHVEELSEKTESLSLEKEKLESKIRESNRGRAGAEKLISKLANDHPWIDEESEQFGVEGSPYVFDEERTSSSRKKVEALEARQESLAKKINKKAMHLFETAKEEYRNLMKKRGIIETDKEKIERTIGELDRKKLVALEKTWRKVNADFGNIFSDLLPGTSARLEPPEGMSVEDGLEIRVAFGDVWKDSLSELSGGQRSLIALSLILAMLRFKPAPMYILDEVDAALDLSHTQNIGRMLRRHFSGSQFIVVSLKEGMFGNANVIFRTKFVDGVSTIKRTENNPDPSIEKAVTAADVESEVDKENLVNGATVRAGSRRKRQVLD